MAGVPVLTQLTELWANSALEQASLCICDEPTEFRIYLWDGNILSTSWKRIEQGSFRSFSMKTGDNSWALTAPFSDPGEHICSDESQPYLSKKDEDGLSAKNLVTIQHQESHMSLQNIKILF